MATGLVWADNAYGTLGAALAVGDTSLTFTTGHGARFPAVAAGQVMYCCLLNSNNVIEEIQVTAHTADADTCTIVRGQNGTTAKAWSAGDRIEGRVSSEVLEFAQQEANKETALATADSGQVYTATLSPVPKGYVNNQSYFLSCSVTNTGTAPTINLNSLGAKTVKLDGGGALAASSMPAHGIYLYDATDMILMNPLGPGNAATQAQMETGTAVNVFATPGRAQYHPGVAKAWAKISVTTGSMTLDANYNIATAVRNDTGDFTFNFTTPFSNANYCMVPSVTNVVGTGLQSSRDAKMASITTTACRVRTMDGQTPAFEDPAYASFVFFGDQ